MKTTIYIQNLKCGGCAATIKDRISKLSDRKPEGKTLMLIEEDVDDVAEFVAHDFTPEELHNGRMLRNRLNGFFRNHEEQSTRWWTQHYTRNMDRIQAAQQMEGSYHKNLKKMPFND